MSDNKLSFYDFSGGINTCATKILLGYGAKKLNWDDSYNVTLYKNQGVARMAGNREFARNEENSAILAMCEYPKSTEGFVFVQADGKVKHYEPTSRNINIIYDYEKPLSNAEFALYLDGVAIAVSEGEPIYFNINATVNVETLGAKTLSDAIIYPDCVCTFAGRLWLGLGSTLYYSALGRHNDWQSADDAGYISNFHSSTAKITALATYCGSLAIFKSDGVYLLNGSSPSDFSVVKFADKGVEGAKALCTCNNKQYFFNADGLFALSQVGELSQIMMSGNIANPIKDNFTNADKTRMDSAFCVPYEKENQIWFYLPQTNENSFKTILIYNFLHDCWTKRIEPQSITSAANVFGEIMSGCLDGQLLYENIGSTFDQEPIKFRFSTPFFHLGKPSERKIIEDFAILIDDVGENRFRFSTTKDFIKEVKSDVEYINVRQSGALVWASVTDEKNDSNCWFDIKGPAWSRSVECAVGIQIFDSNVSVALHIEGENTGDDFKLIGIEFKELINDF